MIVLGLRNAALRTTLFCSRSINVGVCFLLFGGKERERESEREAFPRRVRE